MYCWGINRKYPLAGDGSWKIWRSYSALGEYGLWKNLKFGSASPRQVQNMNAIFSMTRHQRFAINTPTIHVSVQLHSFHEVEIKQHRVKMTEYVFHTLEANPCHFFQASWSSPPSRHLSLPHLLLSPPLEQDQQLHLN